MRNVELSNAEFISYQKRLVDIYHTLFNQVDNLPQLFNRVDVYHTLFNQVDNLQHDSYIINQVDSY